MDTKPFLNNVCIYCEGPIEFPADGVGERVNCPHCAELITLTKPHIKEPVDESKLECKFCHRTFDVTNECWLNLQRCPYCDGKILDLQKDFPHMTWLNSAGKPAPSKNPISEGFVAMCMAFGILALLLALWPAIQAFFARLSQ